MIDPDDRARDQLLDEAADALRAVRYARDGARETLIRALKGGGRPQPARVRAPRRRTIARVATAMAIAAGVIVVVLARGDANHAVPASLDPRTSLVEFSFEAPTARLVSLVGEFNGWNDRATPLRRGADGRWTTTVALEPGRHTYGFRVDGARLVPDPTAPAAPEQLYGVRHSVVVVPVRAVYQ